MSRIGKALPAENVDRASLRGKLCIGARTISKVVRIDINLIYLIIKTRRIVKQLKRGEIICNRDACNGILLRAEKTCLEYFIDLHRLT